MKRSTIFSFLLVSSLLLSGCSQTQQIPDSSTATQTSTPVEVTNTVALADLFSTRDLEIGYEEESAVFITLSGDSAVCDSNAVSIADGVVTILDEGTYILSGTLTDGMIVVNAEETDKVQLVLDDVNITCATSAAIYIPSADKVFLTTAAESENVLQNGGSYVAIDDNNIDAVIFAKSDLTLNGAGTLTIVGEAGHGVVTKDDLVVTSGTYVVTAGSHGLCGKDSVAISGGIFTLTTGKDGIQSENEEDSDKGYVYLSGGTYTVAAEGDGFSASSWMQVDGGAFSVTTGGGSVNGETHVSDMPFGGKGEQFFNLENAEKFAGAQRPEDFTPPENFTPSEDFTPPEGFEEGEERNAARWF